MLRANRYPLSGSSFVRLRLYASGETALLPGGVSLYAGYALRSQGLFCIGNLSGHGFQPLLFRLYLELCHRQMFLGTATLSTLQIGISGGSHEIKKVILQHTVGRLQNLFPFCVQHRIAIFIENLCFFCFYIYGFLKFQFLYHCRNR